MPKFSFSINTHKDLFFDISNTRFLSTIKIVLKKKYEVLVSILQLKNFLVTNLDTRFCQNLYKELKKKQKTHVRFQQKNF